MKTSLRWTEAGAAVSDQGTALLGGPWGSSGLSPLRRNKTEVRHGETCKVSGTKDASGFHELENLLKICTEDTACS